jgi:hypothetical protein
MCYVFYGLLNFMFVDCASLYNLVNRTNVVHNQYVYCFSLHVSGNYVPAHHQENLPYLCDTWYTSLYMDDCLVCRAHTVYCFSLHVSGNYVPIIRRIYRTYATPGIHHSIWMTVWYAGRIPPCIPDSHPYRDIYQVSHRYGKFS